MNILGYSDLKQDYGYSHLWYSLQENIIVIQKNHRMRTLPSSNIIYKNSVALHKEGHRGVRECSQSVPHDSVCNNANFATISFV